MIAVCWERGRSKERASSAQCSTIDNKCSRWLKRSRTPDRRVRFRFTVRGEGTDSNWPATFLARKLFIYLRVVSVSCERYARRILRSQVEAVATAVEQRDLQSVCRRIVCSAIFADKAVGLC